eukprot:3858140-Prymnesium_polylepis.1
MSRPHGHALGLSLLSPVSCVSGLIRPHQTSSGLIRPHQAEARAPAIAAAQSSSDQCLCSQRGDVLDTGEGTREIAFPFTALGKYTVEVVGQDGMQVPASNMARMHHVHVHARAHASCP